jgi:hypothetical protein
LHEDALGAGVAREDVRRDLERTLAKLGLFKSVLDADDDLQLRSEIARTLELDIRASQVCRTKACVRSRHTHAVQDAQEQATKRIAPLKVLHGLGTELAYAKAALAKCKSDAANERLDTESVIDTFHIKMDSLKRAMTALELANANLERELAIDPLPLKVCHTRRDSFAHNSIGTQEGQTKLAEVTQALEVSQRVVAQSESTLRLQANQCATLAEDLAALSRSTPADVAQRTPSIIVDLLSLDPVPLARAASALAAHGALRAVFDSLALLDPLSRDQSTHLAIQLDLLRLHSSTPDTSELDDLRARLAELEIREMDLQGELTSTSMADALEMDDIRHSPPLPTFPPPFFLSPTARRFYPHADTIKHSDVDLVRRADKLLAQGRQLAGLCSSSRIGLG